MKKGTLLIIISLTINSVFSQGNYKSVIAEAIENYNYSKIDSLAKTIGYKGGEEIKTIVSFKVNHEGKTFEISAKGPHKIFIDESIKIVKNLPKLEFGVPLKKGQHFMFNLPIKYKISKKRKSERNTLKMKDNN